MMAVLEAAALTIDLPADRLVLTSADTGERLELVTSTPLEGSTWLLTRIAGQPRPNEPVTLRLVDGQVSGEGPCGPYAGRYDSDGLFISFSGMSSSKLEACPERGWQRELLATLERAVLLDRDQPQLRFLDAGGRIVARFARPAGP